MTWNLAEVILHWNLLLHADEEGGEPRWRPCLERPYNHPSWSPYVEGSYHTRGQVGWYYRTPWLLLWMLPHPAPPRSHQEPIETKSPLVAFQVLKSACIAQCNEWEVAEVLIRICDYHTSQFCLLVCLPHCFTIISRTSGLLSHISYKDITTV